MKIFSEEVCYHYKFGFCKHEIVDGKNTSVKFVKIKAVVEEMNATRDILENVNSFKITKGVSLVNIVPLTTWIPSMLLRKDF